MSTLSASGIRRNRATTRQLLEREAAYNRREAAHLRDYAQRCLEKAVILEHEAQACERALLERDAAEAA